MNTATFNSLYNPNRPLNISMQFLTRIVKIFFLLGALAWLLFGFAESTFAIEGCESNNCTFACSQATHHCAFFNPKNIRAGYTRVTYLPKGYQRVASQCTLPKCPSGSVTCERWGRAKPKG